jgi:signal transduction histidine kinase
MNRDSALSMLASTSPHERLKAARFLSRNPHINDLESLQTARHIETVSWVKSSLDSAISKHSHHVHVLTAEPEDEPDIPEDVKRQIRNQAIKDVARLLLHEIASPIGFARNAARREIKEYKTSKTKAYLDQVQRIFKAIEQLTRASSGPNRERFDLAVFIDGLVAAELSDFTVSVSAHGPRPMPIFSDPSLLLIAIANGVRNAVESVKSLNNTDTHQIVITWGETDIDYWVSIIDKGRGIVGSTEAAFELGSTTKQGHTGFGLATARNAIELLNGSVTLHSAAGGGARYEVKWEQ